MGSAWSRVPEPRAVRRAVLVRAGGRCEDCGERLRLELHHTTYDLMDVTGHADDVGKEIFGRETPDVLLALCRAHHLARHIDRFGEFHRNPKDAGTSEFGGAG